MSAGIWYIFVCMSEINNIEKIGILITGFLRNELSDTEYAALQQWIEASNTNKEQFEELTDTERLIEKIRAWREAGTSEELVWQRIESYLYPKPRKIYQLNWVKIAAAIILVIGFATIWYWVNQGRDKKDLPQVVKRDTDHTNDVLPGGFKAKLQLADGTTIILDSAINGKLRDQGSTAIMNKDGHLMYTTTTGNGKENAPVFNTLYTSNGETYMLTLSDGSKVWLNAASSIKYPVVFTEQDRRVEIQGEAYFEVVADATKPFIVDASGTEIKVLGTHFNVNAYGDETAIKATLLEGKINITSVGSGSTKTLHPGQQARVDANGNMKIAADVDLEEVMAWKNEKFVFDNTNIQVIMKQLERWYDLETVFVSNEVKKYPFNGEISRYTNASKVLNLLEKTGFIHYKIEGKKVFISK